MSKRDTRQIFHLLPLCLSGIKIHIRNSLLSHLCCLLSFSLSFIPNLKICLSAQRTPFTFGALHLQVHPFSLIYSFVFSISSLSVLLSVSVGLGGGQRQSECSPALDVTKSIMRSSLSDLALHYLYHSMILSFCSARPFFFFFFQWMRRFVALCSNAYMAVTINN